MYPELMRGRGKPLRARCDSPPRPRPSCVNQTNTETDGTESGHVPCHCAVNHNPWSMKKKTDVPFLPFPYQTKRARFRKFVPTGKSTNMATRNSIIEQLNFFDTFLTMCHAASRWPHDLTIQNGKEMKFIQVCLDLFEGHGSGCSSNDTIYLLKYSIHSR